MTQIQRVHYQAIHGKTYKEVWDMQHTLHYALIERKKALKEQGIPPLDMEQPHQLILCEHAPVYTLGRSGDEQNLLLTEEKLRANGIEYFPINRGGDITYHGPGQITGYPILDLDCFYNDVHKFVRMLEEAVIRTIAEYGLEGTRIGGYTGVWLTDQGKNRKICAIGVHLSRWVTLHGFALNVNTDLNYFKHIVPCGIVDEDKTVTSIAQELGREVDMEEVRQKYLKHFTELFGCKLV